MTNPTEREVELAKRYAGVIADSGDRENVLALLLSGYRREVEQKRRDEQKAVLDRFRKGSVESNENQEQSMNEAQRKELRLRFGPKTVAHEHPELGLFIFRKPTRSEWKQLQIRAQANDADANEELCADCLVWPELSKDSPDKGKLEDLWEESPALAGPLSSALGKLAGLGDNAAGKL